MNRLVFIFIFITFNKFLFSQDYVDLAKFHWATSPNNTFDSIGGKTNVEEIGADILLPVKLNDAHIVLTGLYVEQIKTQFHPLAETSSLYTFNLKIGYNRIHSEKWSGTYMFLPKLSSDMEITSPKNMQFGGLLLMKYSKSKTQNYSFGAYYNNELFGPFVVPLLGMYYKSANEKFEVNATLPIWADINYKLINFISVGTNFSAFVRSYYLSENNAYVVKKTNELFGYLQFNITKNIVLQTKTGYSIGRSYRAYDESNKVDFGFSAFRFGDNRTVLNPDFNDGLIFRIRLIYRYNLNKKME